MKRPEALKRLCRPCRAPKTPWRSWQAPESPLEAQNAQKALDLEAPEALAGPGASRGLQNAQKALAGLQKH